MFPSRARQRAVTCRELLPDGRGMESRPGRHAFRLVYRRDVTMTRHPLVMSPDYVAYVRGIRELHRLTMAGKDESPEAEAVRDMMDGPWEGLTKPERDRIGGLSEDQFSISDPPTGEPLPMNSQAQSKLNDVYEARMRGEWDRALELLRRWGKYVSPALLSYWRGLIWFDAGDLDTAVLFLEHATKLDAEYGKHLEASGVARLSLDPK